jgi:hypothetical protein
LDSRSTKLERIQRNLDKDRAMLEAVPEKRDRPRGKLGRLRGNIDRSKTNLE